MRREAIQVAAMALRFVEDVCESDKASEPPADRLAQVEAERDAALKRAAEAEKERDEARAWISACNERAARSEALARALQEDREEDFADMVNERDGALARANASTRDLAAAQDRIAELEGKKRRNTA
jgi:hypothetical protein